MSQVPHQTVSVEPHPTPAVQPDLAAWQAIVRCAWLLNSLSVNLREPQMQLDRLPQTFDAMREQLSSVRVSGEMGEVLEDELRTALEYLRVASAGLEEAQRRIEATLQGLWEMKKREA